MELAEFKTWSKIPRLEKMTVHISEKIDGTNAQIYVHEDGTIQAGSRSRWLKSGKEDNFGFNQWIQDRKDTINKILTPGRYYGEFVGPKINRGYDLKEYRLYLFWPTVILENFGEEIYSIPYEIETTKYLDNSIALFKNKLRETGSCINNYPYPEGVIIRIDSQRWKDYIFENVRGKAPLRKQTQKHVASVDDRLTQLYST